MQPYIRKNLPKGQTQGRLYTPPVRPLVVSPKDALKRFKIQLDPEELKNAILKL